MWSGPDVSWLHSEGHFGADQAAGMPELEEACVLAGPIAGAAVPIRHQDVEELVDVEAAARTLATHCPLHGIDHVRECVMLVRAQVVAVPAVHGQPQADLESRPIRHD